MAVSRREFCTGLAGGVFAKKTGDEVLVFRPDASKQKVKATGGAVSRTLADRFADVINVKDFGAKGDGVTDDTAAFEAAASTGRTVFVPEGSYKVMQAVAGDFISNGNTAVPFVDIKSANLIEGSPTDFLHMPCNCGGDYPDRSSIDGNVSEGEIEAWGRATQAAMVDPYENILYVTCVQANGKSQIEAMHWSEKASERTKIAISDWSINFLGHQGTFLYKPYKNAEALFVSKGNEVSLASNVQDFAELLNIHVVKWDYTNPSQFTIEKNLQAFETDVFVNNEYGGMQIACSPDGKYLVARAKRSSDNKNIYRIWDLHAIMLGVTTDLLASYISQFEEPSEITFGGQGLATDGNHIYVLSGSSNLAVSVLTFQGSHCFSITSYISEITKEFSEYNYSIENESLFFAPWNAKIRMFTMGSCSVYNKNYDSETGTYLDYSRYNRYYCWDSSGEILRCSPMKILDNNITIEKTASTPDITLKRRDVELKPNAGGNFYTNLYFKDKNDQWVSVIQPSRFNTRSCIRLRTLTADKTKEAEIRLDAFDNNVLACGVEAYIYPLTTNVYALGSGSNKWSNIYATTSSIGSSDERAKTLINSPSEDLIRAWSRVGFKVFKFKEAVESKGEAARYHVGVIAQDVAVAFSEEGLNAGDYGLFCFDQWEAQEEELNEDGTVATPASPAGDAYGIRYGEALALECAYQRHRADLLEERVSALEERLAQLEARLSVKSELS